MTGLERIFNAFNNPEDIDDGRETAPSKRILSIIPDYEKVVFGNIIALEIGLSTMLTKCPRFNYWLTRLIGKTTL